MIRYFYFGRIDLINNHKNVDLHNDNNMWCFLWESLVLKRIMRVFSDLWVYFFNAIINVIIRDVMGMGKNMWGL